MNDIAQKWANNLAAKDMFEHSGDHYKGKKLGENIAFKQSSSGKDFTGIRLCLSAVSYNMINCQPYRLLYLQKISPEAGGMQKSAKTPSKSHYANPYTNFNEHLE